MVTLKAPTVTTFPTLSAVSGESSVLRYMVGETAPGVPLDRTRPRSVPAVTVLPVSTVNDPCGVIVR